MTTQSIIVYRNPLEAAMWEGIMSGGFPVILFMILMLVISVMLFIGYEWVCRRSFRIKRILDDWNNTVIVAILTAAAAASYFILV